MAIHYLVWNVQPATSLSPILATSPSNRSALDWGYEVLFSVVKNVSKQDVSFIFIMGCLCRANMRIRGMLLTKTSRGENHRTKVDYHLT